MNKSEKEIVNQLIDDLLKFYKDGGIPYEFIDSLQKVAKLADHKVMEAYVEGWEDRCLKAEAEVARLKGETYCAYCGERFPLDAPDATTQIGAHIGTCPKHPMRAVEAERDALKAELREAIKSGAWLQGELTEAKGQLVVLKYDNTPKKEEP